MLCGGRGLRLKPLTNSIPKPMVYLRGKPLVEYIVDYFSNRGYKEFILAIGYKGEIIKEHFKKKKGYKIEYVVGPAEMDTIQRVYSAKDLVSERFFVLYGDAIANIDINKLLKFHESHKGLVTITTYPLQSPFGLLFSKENGTVHAFKEKPILNYWMNIGFMVFEKEALKHISKNDNMVSFLNKLIVKNKLYEYKHRGKHITVNTAVEKKAAEKELDKFYIYMGGDKNEK